MFRTPLPSPCRVKIENGTQSKRCEIDRLLTKDFSQNFKERYHHKRKESQGSNPKNYLPEEAPQRKSSKDISLCKSFDFSKGVIRVAKIAFSLERLHGMTIGTEFGRTFFAGFFFKCLFFSGANEKIHLEKNSQKPSQ